MKLKDLTENTVIKAYHGSNKPDIVKFRPSNPESVDKDAAIFFTDDPEYALMHGNYIYTVNLTPKNALTPKSIAKIKDRDIIYALKEDGVTGDDEFFDKMVEIAREQIEDYQKRQNVSGLFEGMGGFQILKHIFDLIIFRDSGDVFFLALDPSIIEIVSVNKMAV